MSTFLNLPLSEGMITLGNIYGTLGEVVAGKKEGGGNEKEITIFDSTGLAIQAIICANFVYEKAKRNATTEEPICLKVSQRGGRKKETSKACSDSARSSQ